MARPPLPLASTSRRIRRRTRPPSHSARAERYSHGNRRRGLRSRGRPRRVPHHRLLQPLFHRSLVSSFFPLFLFLFLFHRNKAPTATYDPHGRLRSLANSTYGDGDLARDGRGAAETAGSDAARQRRGVVDRALRGALLFSLPVPRLESTRLTKRPHSRSPRFFDQQERRILSNGDGCSPGSSDCTPRLLRYPTTATDDSVFTASRPSPTPSTTAS